MTSIRVAQVIARMNVGGPAVLIADLIRGLPRDLFTVDLATGTCGSEEEDYLLSQALDIHATRIPGFGRAVRPFDDLRALPSLKQYLKRSNPNIIHTHTAKAGVLGRQAARMGRSQARLVHTFHGHLLSGYFNPAKTSAVAAIERFLASRTDVLVSIGEQVRDDLLDRGIGTPEQFRVIPPGIAPPTTIDRETARRVLGVPEHRQVVSMIGRLTSIKRIDRFLDLAAMAKSDADCPIFLIAGGGEFEREAQDRVRTENLPVKFLGWVDDVGVVLSATDVVVLTSDNEGMPLSLIQAGMAGVAVVATNVGSVKEIVTSEVTGLLAAPDSEDLFAKLSRLLKDATLRESIGTNARAVTRSKFSLDVMIQAHAKLYEELT